MWAHVSFFLFHAHAYQPYALAQCLLLVGDGLRALRLIYELSRW
jgi:hypothetical protein